MRSFFATLCGAGLLVGLLHLAPAETARAKCYHFRNAPSYVGVCMKGDSFAARKKARKCCSKKLGKDCGNVTSYSSSCHSNKNKCYDHNCKAKRSLSGYSVGLEGPATTRAAVQGHTDQRAWLGLP
jgi:hypothetical protein